MSRGPQGRKPSCLAAGYGLPEAPDRAVEAALQRRDKVCFDGGFSPHGAQEDNHRP